MTAVPRHEIVVGVDGSPASAAALRWAARQARFTGCALRAVMAWEVKPTMSMGWPPMPRNPDAEKRAFRTLLATVEAELGEHEDVAVAPSVVEGVTGDVLVALSRDAELLVVGNRGHRHAPEAVLGSVSQHCVSKAGSPVVVVRGSVASGGVVVGVDGSKPSLEALGWAAEQAALTGSTLRLVHAGEAAARDRSGVEAEWRRAAQAGSARVSPQHHGASVVVEKCEGHAADVLVAASEGAELLVVGSRGRGPLTGVALGSVSMRCVQHAMCPVVVYRHRAAARGRVGGV